jgi:hypothetical protein
MMEATMRRFFPITAILLSATTAHAGLDTTVANADVRAPEAIQSSLAQRPDASALAAERDAMIQQKMAIQKQIMMRKQMATQREMQRHPIRTRVHFALLRFKQKMHSVFR